MNPELPDRRLDRSIALGIAAFSFGIVVWLLAAGVHVTDEDGFYYFRIAQHIAGGAGSTFDGQHPTNGCHPLWLLCLVPVFWLTSSPQTALVLGTLLQGVFFAAGTVLIYAIARLDTGRPAAIVAALLWVKLVYPLSIGGVEFSLYGCGVLLSAYLYLRRFAEEFLPPLRAYFALGVILSFAFLARLETVLLAFLMGCSLAWRAYRCGMTRTHALRLLAFGTPVLITCLAYIAVNMSLFGHPYPISGHVKRDWSLAFLMQDPRYRAGGWLTAKAFHLLWPFRHLVDDWFARYVALGTFGIAGLWLATAVGRRPSTGRGGLHGILQRWRPLLLFSLLSYLGYVCFLHGDLSFEPRYYLIQPVLAVLLAAVLIDRLTGGHASAAVAAPQPRWRRPLTGGALVLIGTVAVLVTLRSLRDWRHAEQHGLGRDAPLHAAAEWAREHLPPDAVIGAWDAGAIGYLSDRRVVNLDGVVNSWDYFESDRHDLCGYWQQAGITHLVDAFKNGRLLTTLPTYSDYSACAGRLERIWSDPRYGTSWHMEVYRIRPAASEKNPLR